MKSHYLFVLAAVLATAASAQELQANIPFDFSVSNKRMPAGEYRVSRAMMSGSNFVLQFRSLASRQSAMAVASSEIDGNQAAGRVAKLVFSCRSGECFLSQVHSPGATTARRFHTAPLKAGEQERVVAVAASRSAGGSGY